jgi:hypothetical protein
VDVPAAAEEHAVQARQEAGQRGFFQIERNQDRPAAGPDDCPGVSLRQVEVGIAVRVDPPAE